MGQQLFVHGFNATLAAGVAVGAVSVQLKPAGIGSMLPTLNNGDYLILQITAADGKEAFKTNVRVTGRNGDILTLDYMSADWPAGSICRLSQPPSFSAKYSPGRLKEGLLRQISNNCRFPNISFGLRQYYGKTFHRFGANVEWMRFGFLNATGYQEIQGAGNLQIVYGVEYPIGRDDLQLVISDGSEFHSCTSGSDLLTDKLKLDRDGGIEGDLFKLYTFVYSTASGIPGSYSGPQPWVNGAATYGLSIQSGSNTTNIDYFFTATTAAQRDALVNNGVTNGNVQVTPLCIVSDADVSAMAIWGDSNWAGQSAVAPWNYDYVSDISLRQCTGERVLGHLMPWINLSASQDSMGNMTVAGGARRAKYLKYVTDVVNGLGTNDIDGAASDAALQALDEAFAVLNGVAGKRLWGTTIPPKTTSTNQFIDAAGQTVSVGNSRRVNLNTYRKSSAKYGGRVIDLDSIADPTGSGKYQGNGRVFSGTMTVGSNIVNGSGFVASEDGKTVAINGAGASGAVLIGRQVYVSSTQIKLVDPVTGADINCVTAVSGAVAYANCRENTADGTHGTQYLNQKYEALKPATRAMAATI